MSTSLFGLDGNTYNQTAILTPDNKLDPAKLEQVGLPRFTATYVVSQLCYNLSLGAAIVHVCLWNWKELKEGRFVLWRLQGVNTDGPSSVCLYTQAFGGFKFMRSGQDIDDIHYKGRRFMRAI